MSNVIEVQFGGGILPNEDKFVTDLQPLLEDMVEHISVLHQLIPAQEMVVVWLRVKV